jgi:hypothetical protein
MPFLSLTGILRPRWQLSASGATHSSLSIASHRKFSPSSHPSLSRGRPTPRRLRVPSLAQNLHSTRCTVVTIGPDDQKERSLRENPARARERVPTGYQIHSSRLCNHPGAAFTLRSTIQGPRPCLRLLVKHSEVLRSRFWTTPATPHPQNQCGRPCVGPEATRSLPPSPSSAVRLI